MTRLPLSVAATLFISAGPLSTIAAAEEAPSVQVAPDHSVQLDEHDRQLITMEVLKSQPLLSASPGIKAVDAFGGYSSDEDKDPALVQVIANVIFYPHAESRGVKQAFQAHCSRSASGGDWTCFAIELRRYVRLDTQDFDVRVTANLDLAAILAVVEATRQPAAAAAMETSEVADTASSIFACSDGYIVSWGSKDGEGRIGLIANLRTGGNSAEPGDWQVRKQPVL